MLLSLTGSTFTNESCIVLLGCNPVILFTKLPSASKKCGLLTNSGAPKTYYSYNIV